MSHVGRRGHSFSRYADHDYAARKGRDLPVYRAWRKHGAPKEEIISTHASRDECAKAEINAIRNFGSTDRNIGYNVTNGGDGFHFDKGSEPYWKIGNKTWANAKWCAEHAARMMGHPDMRTPEGKERQRASAVALANSGHAKRMRAEAFKNPETIRKFEAGRAKWRESARNRDNCRRIASLSAQACSRPVMDVKAGIEYSSQHAMAAALGVSDATISRRVVRGTCVRL